MKLAGSTRSRVAAAAALLALVVRAPGGHAALRPTDVVLPPLPAGLECASRKEVAEWLGPVARQSLDSWIPPGTTLGEPHVRQALGSWTLRFPQERQGLRIQDAGLVVSVAPRADGLGLDVRLVEDSLVAAAPAPIPDVVVTAAEAEALALEVLLGDKRGPARVVRHVGAARLQLDASGAIPSWAILVRGLEPAIDLHVLVSALDGRILDSRDLIRRVTGQGRVFDPNPVAALGDITLQDQGDAASAVPDAAYVLAALPELDPPLGGLHALRGRNVAVEDLLPPADAPALEADPAGFEYARDDDRFEQVMAYHVVDGMRRHVQSFGFADVMDRQIRVDAHAQDAEGSFFSAADFTLSFGDGGVDDAEDADVIVHEWTHAMQEDVVPGFGATAEARAVAEGMADYLAASRHALGPFPACVAAWDATAYSADSPPCMRRVDTLKTYPSDMSGDPHADGEILAAALWDARRDIGSDVLDAVVVQSHFLMGTAPTFREAGLALLDADYELDTRVRMETCLALAQRGILDRSDCPADLSIADVVVDDSGGGDGDGWLEPGETSSLVVRIRSMVRATHRNLQVRLRTGDARCAVLAGTATHPDMAGRGISQPHAPGHRVRVAPFATCGDRIRFDVDIVSDSFLGFESFWIALGEPIPDAPVTGSWNGPPIPIPDDNATGVAATISLPPPLRVAAVTSVGVDIAHPHRGDLVVELMSPGFVVVVLQNLSGGAADDLITSYPIPSPVQGPGALGDFLGQSVAGNWLLHVTDRDNNDTGELRAWNIAIDTYSANCLAGATCTAQEIATGSDGLLRVSKAGEEIVLTHPGQATSCAAGVQVRRSPTPRPSSGGGQWPLDPPFEDVTPQDLDPGAPFRHVPLPGLSCYLVVEVLPNGLWGPSGSY